jgi:hypothetical protein
VACPRFLLVTGVAFPDQSRRAWAGSAISSFDPRRPSHDLRNSDRSMWVAWRLLGRNNRELGRSPVTYRSVAACLAGITRLKADIDVDIATRILAVDPEDGRWIWRLESLGALGAATAVSSRSYQRQRECLYSVNQFVVGVTDAALPATEIAMPSPPRRPDAPPDSERASPDDDPAVASAITSAVDTVIAPITAPITAPVSRGHLRVAGGMAS